MPNTGPGSRHAVLAAAAVACSLFGDMAMYTVLPIMHETLALTPFQVGILLSANRWIRLVTNDAARRLLDRISPAVLMVVALVLGAGIASAYSVAPAFPIFLGLRLLWGFCWSILRQAGVMTAAATAVPERVGRVIGVYSGIVKVGFLVGTLLSGLLLDVVGFKAMFLILAGLSLGGLIPAGFTAGSEPFREHERTVDTSANRRVGIPLMLKGFLFGAAGSGAIMSTLGHVLHTTAGDSVSIAGLTIGIATVNGVILATRHMFGIAGSPAAGAIVDRIGIRRVERTVLTIAVCALGVAFAVPGVVAPVVSVVVFSACEVLLYVALTADATQTGKRYAKFVTALDAGAAFGPLAAWMLVGGFGGSRLGFLTGAILYCVAAVVSFVTRHKVAPIRSMEEIR